MTDIDVITTIGISIDGAGAPFLRARAAGPACASGKIVRDLHDIAVRVAHDGLVVAPVHARLLAPLHGPRRMRRKQGAQRRLLLEHQDGERAEAGAGKRRAGQATCALKKASRWWSMWRRPGRFSVAPTCSLHVGAVVWAAVVAAVAVLNTIVPFGTGSLCGYSSTMA